MNPRKHTKEEYDCIYRYVEKNLDATEKQVIEYFVGWNISKGTVNRIKSRIVSQIIVKHQIIKRHG